MIGVRGNCPMGCGPTLILGKPDGAVLCRDSDCPRPSAAHELLADVDTEHLVQLTDHDFTVQHPIRERLDGELWSCQLHEQLHALSGPPRPPGTYRVVEPRLEGEGPSPSIDTWDWTEVPS